MRKKRKAYRVCGTCGKEPCLPYNQKCASCWADGTYIGKECPKGHGNLRYTRNRTCVTCCKQNSIRSVSKRRGQLSGKFVNARTIAKKRGLEFSLTLEEYSALMVSSCHWCGGEGGGIDRYNNDYGYTRENSVPCCRPCNVAKSDMSVAAFTVLVERIYKHSVAPGVTRAK